MHVISHRKPKKYIHSTTKIHKNILDLIDKGWDLKFQWIPSHCDITGNDNADKYANIGRTLTNITYPIELNDIHWQVKKQMVWRWQQHWNIEKQYNSFGLLKPIIGNWYWCRHKNRSLDVIMTKLRLGKVGLNKYLHRINLSPTELCNQCNAGEIEDVEHFLLHCQKYNPQRMRLFSFMRSIGFPNVTLNNLLGAANTDIENKKRITMQLATYIKSTDRMSTL